MPPPTNPDSKPAATGPLAKHTIRSWSLPSEHLLPWIERTKLSPAANGRIVFACTLDLTNGTRIRVLGSLHVGSTGEILADYSHHEFWERIAGSGANSENGGENEPDVEQSSNWRLTGTYEFDRLPKPEILDQLRLSLGAALAKLLGPSNIGVDAGHLLKRKPDTIA